MAEINTQAAGCFAFAAGLLILAFPAGYFLGRKLSWVDRLILWWIVWTAVIHLTLEVPFVIIAVTTTINASTSFTAIPWKEYGNADMRYLVFDPYIVCLEAFVGYFVPPVSIIWIYMIVRRRDYIRHWIQMFIGSCEIYSMYVYFLSEWISGCKNFSTYWVYVLFYLVAMSGLWVAIPTLLVIHSFVFAFRHDKAQRAAAAAAASSALEASEPPVGGGVKEENVDQHQHLHQHPQLFRQSLPVSASPLTPWSQRPPSAQFIVSAAPPRYFSNSSYCSPLYYRQCR